MNGRNADRPSQRSALTPLPSPVPSHVQAPVRVVRAVLLSPIVWILFLAGLFDGLSANWIHAVVLWVAAVLVGRDAARRARGIAPPPATAWFGTAHRPQRRVAVVVVAAVIAYAVVAASFVPYTWPDTVAIVVPGVLVLAVVWRGPLWVRPVPPAPWAVGATAWAAVFVTAALVELAALLMQPNLQVGSYDHPTISYLMESVLANGPGRALTLLVWVALGYFLLVHCPGDAAPPVGSASRPGPGPQQQGVP